MSQKKVICLIIHSLQPGGMERVMAELASYICATSNYEVHMILYGITREIFYKIPDEVTVHKPSFSFNNKIRFISTVRTLIYLKKQIKRIHPDTILTFGELWNNFVLLSTYGLKYPVYVSDRSQPDKSLGRLHDYLRKKLYPRATGIVAQSSKAKDIYLKEYHHGNIDVIGNPIRSIEEREGLRRENNILMVGRLIKSKNQDKLIEIFSETGRKDWNLVLVGYDHLKQKNMDRLKQLAKDLGVEKNVIFAGKQSDVEKFYLSSRIFAFTSSSEGFPNVIGEAMAAGLPVVSYDCVAGPSEMIRDGYNGYLAPLFDKEIFKSKLELLMNNDSLREEMGVNARESIKKFSSDIIGKQFLTFITATFQN